MKHTEFQKILQTIDWHPPFQYVFQEIFLNIILTPRHWKKAEYRSC